MLGRRSAFQQLRWSTSRRSLGGFRGFLAGVVRVDGAFDHPPHRAGRALDAAQRVGTHHHQHVVGCRVAHLRPCGIEHPPFRAGRLVGWSKTLAGEVAADGITANVIVPGRIATDRVRELDRLRAERASVPVEDVERRSTAAIPAGRYGSVEEYSAAVLFLASGRASFVNGAQLRVDGGMIASV